MAPWGPGIDDIEDQVVDGGEDVVHAVRSGLTAPPAITRLAHKEHAQLRHDPDNDGGERARDNQSRNTAEGGFGHSVEGGILVVLSVELDRLQGAYIAVTKEKMVTPIRPWTRIRRKGSCSTRGAASADEAGRKRSPSKARAMCVKTTSDEARPLRPCGNRGG